MIASKAKARYIKIPPRKARLMADLLRGKPTQEALVILHEMPQKGALFFSKLLKSAMANAENTGAIDVDTLYIQTLFVDEGPTQKRFKPRAQGRATRINRRTSHITMELSER